MDLVLGQFAKLFPEINLALGAGIMIFARFLGLMQFAPGFNRKEIPTIARLSFALIITVIVASVVKIPPVPEHTSIILCIMLNYMFGALIGYIVNCVIATITAGGDMINTQMGMSSAMVMDPTSKAQTSIVGNLFTLLGVIIFMQIGGLYWLIEAFIRSFGIFSMYGISMPIEKVVNMDYLILLTSNVFVVGMQIAAPVLLATLGQDIILGTISKTAPQINVFQMSFLFKPVLGSLILTWILPMLINVITDYISSFSNIF